MYDRTDIGLVDAHTEGIRSDNYSHFSGSPAVLAFDFVLMGQPGVIISGGYARTEDEIGQFTGASSGTDIDYRRTGCVAENTHKQFFFLLGVAHQIGYVRSRETERERSRGAQA